MVLRVLRPILEIQICHIFVANKLPAVLMDDVQIDRATRIRVTVRRMEDGLAAQLDGLFHGQIVTVLRVQHAIRKGRARSHREQRARQTGAIRVHIIQSRAL